MVRHLSRFIRLTMMVGALFACKSRETNSNVAKSADLPSGTSETVPIKPPRLRKPNEFEVNAVSMVEKGKKISTVIHNNAGSFAVQGTTLWNFIDGQLWAIDLQDESVTPKLYRKIAPKSSKLIGKGISNAVLTVSTTEIALVFTDETWENQEILLVSTDNKPDAEVLSIGGNLRHCVDDQNCIYFVPTQLMRVNDQILLVNGDQNNFAYTSNLKEAKWTFLNSNIDAFGGLGGPIMIDQTGKYLFSGGEIPLDSSFLDVYPMTVENGTIKMGKVRRIFGQQGEFPESYLGNRRIGSLTTVNVGAGSSQNSLYFAGCEGCLLVSQDDGKSWSPTIVHQGAEDVVKPEGEKSSSPSQGMQYPYYLGAVANDQLVVAYANEGNSNNPKQMIAVSRLPPKDQDFDWIDMTDAIFAKRKANYALHKVVYVPELSSFVAITTTPMFRNEIENKTATLELTRVSVKF